MKDYFNLRKSKMLLLAILALLTGSSPVWAQENVTESFETGGLPDGWEINNSNQTNSNYQISISNDAGHNSTSYSLFCKYNKYSGEYCYVVLPEVTGTISLYAKSYSSSSNGNLSVYRYNNGVLGTQVGTQMSKKSTSWGDDPWTFQLEDGETTQVAIAFGGLYVDDITVTYPAEDFPKPKGLAFSNITFNSATAAWQAGTATSWNLKYKSSADEDFTSIDALTENSYNFENLTDNTTYEVKLQSVYETGVSSFVNSSFKTLVAPITTFPYTENFNSVTTGIPSGWDNSEGTTTTSSYKWSYFTEGHDGGCVRFDSYNNTKDKTNFLKTPKMKLPADKNMQLTFWYMNPKGGDFSVYISNDGGETYSTALATGLVNASDWTEYSVNIPNDFKDNVVIVFKGTSNYGSGDAYIYLDDITVEQQSACAKPDAFAIDDITENSATFSWTSEASAWNIQYKKATDEEWTSVNEITTNPYTLTGLTANTAYKVRIQANCGGDEVSGWATELTFTTDCATIKEFPFTENFNGITAGIPLCWDNTEGTTSDNSYKWNYYANGHGTGNACLRFNSYNNKTNMTNMLKTPTISFTEGKAMLLSFWYKNPNGGDFSVYISNDGGKTYETALATGLTGQADWAKKEIAIPTTFTDNVVIVFKGTSNWGSNDAYIYLDDVTIEPMPSCAKPTAVECTALTTTSATITWTSEATMWNIRYKKIGDEEWTVINDVDANTYTITGLTPATTYEYQIQTNCGGDEVSNWTDAANFTTDCSVITEFPFTEDFNGITAGIPLCWDNTEGTTTNENYKWSYSASGNSGACVRFESTSNGSGNTNMLKTPVMNMPAGKVMQLSFFYKNPKGSDFSVFISKDGGATYETALATSLPEKSAWTKEEMIIPADFTENVVIVFKGVSNYGYGDSNIYLDDVTIDEAPACITPTALASGNITARSAELSWTNGYDETAWQIAYSTEADFNADEVTPVNASTNPFTLTGLQPETKYYVCIRSKKDENVSPWSEKINFTTEPSCIAPTNLAISAIGINTVTLSWTDNIEEQDTWEVSYSTTAGDPDNGTIVTVNTKSCTLDNLSSKTTYYAYVRAKCSDEDKSQWSAVCEFTPGTFTVNEGTALNTNIPFYGYYADTSTKSQFIIPATSLSGIANTEIQKIIFYSSNTSTSWGNGEFDVYMSIVDNTEFEETAYADWTSMTNIYSGKVAIVDKKMTIELAEPITYTGGNIMFGFNLKTKGNDSKASFYGVETESFTAIAGYGSSNNTRYKFLPKMSFEYEPISDAAKMAVSTETLDFGMIHPSFSDEEKQLTFNIKNKGNADLTGINVSYTGDDAFSTSAVENANIAAKGNDIVVTVTINTENAGNYSGTITVSADGQTNAEIAVSGTVLDANKMFENFAGNALPEDWETAGVGSYTTGSYSSSYKWTFTEGYASYNQAAGSSSSLANYEHSLVTPYMTFTEGEQLTFKYKKETQYASYLSYLRVEYTADGSTWTQTAEDAITNTSFTSEWQDGSATIPATAKRVRFVGCGVAIDDIYGGQIAQIPVMAFENPGSFSFGVIAADSTSTAFTVKNTGRAEMTGLSITSDNENFIVAVADNATTIAAKSQVTFTVTMKADAKGGQTGKITISADGIDPVEFNVSGYVLDNDAMLVDFADNKLPDGWTKSNMYIVNNEIYVAGFGGTLTSPAITVADGQSLLVYARSRATASAAITVKYSADSGETWTTAKNFTTELRKNTTDYAALIVDNIPAGDYILKFEADNVNISVINGYSYNQEAPALGVTLAGTIITTGYNDNFGLKVKEAMSHTYTIKNTGTGTLTGTITSSVPAHFTVSQAEFSLAQEETLNFDLALVFDENYGEKASVVTIHPTNEGLEDIVINASATTKDPNIWEEDFENGMPAFWTNNGWSVSQPTSFMGGNGTKMAGPSSSKTATLITPRLQATEGQVLKYYVYAESETYFMKAEYSNDKSEWTLIDNYTDAGVKEFTAPADGNYYLRFTGYYTYLDNLEGFKLNLPQHDVNITEKRIPATGAQYVKYTATVSVKELLGKEEEVTAKFFIGETQFGEDVVETVSANGTKVFTVEFTPTEAVSGDAFFTITGTEINLSSEKQAVVISAATQLAETEAPELTDGTYASVVVTYTAHNGYNTICMPFALTDDDMKEIFGPNYEAYEFKSYKNRALNFGPATTFYKGYPYIVYTTAPTNNKLYKQNVEITATAKNDEYNNQNTSVNNSAKFQGTFAPMNSEELNGKLWMNAGGYLNEATEGVSLNGFRAFFEVAEGEEQVSYLTFTNANGQVTSISSLNADKVYGKAYNLKGQRVETMKKGNLYIIDGKKKLAK